MTEHQTTAHTTTTKAPHHGLTTDPTTPPATTPPVDATPVPTPKTIADAAAELITDTDTIQAAMDSALRVIGAMSPADQAKMFQAMDDDDARQGQRERRSAVIRGRLGLLTEKDAAAAAEKAKEPPTPPTTGVDDKTPPAIAADNKHHQEKKGGFFK